MDKDMGKTDTTGKKNYKQPLLGLLHCRENRNTSGQCFIGLGTTTPQVDSLFLSL